SSPGSRSPPPPRNRQVFRPSPRLEDAGSCAYIGEPRFESAQMGWFRRIFVGWENATPGTLLMTWWHGHFVGHDLFGNRYYSSEAGKRRWVIYSRTVEASRVPAEWHGWLHYTFELPPTEEP